MIAIEIEFSGSVVIDFDCDFDVDCSNLGHSDLGKMISKCDHPAVLPLSLVKGYTAMPPMTTTALFLLAAYLLGGIPFGLLLTRWFKGIDIRALGSGNIGATNVRRNAGNTLGALTLLGDLAKGYLPVTAVALLLPNGHPGMAAAMAATAVAAFCGHLFPLTLGFRGGKGVATAGGAYLAIAPAALLGVLAAFGLGLGISRRVSVGSLAAACALPLCVALATGSRPLSVGAVIIAVGIVARHRENIERLILGKEPALF